MMFSGGSSSSQKRDWTTMPTDLERGQVQSLKHSQRGNSVQVQLVGTEAEKGAKYTVGIPGEKSWDAVYTQYAGKIDISRAPRPAAPPGSRSSRTCCRSSCSSGSGSSS